MSRTHQNIDATKSPTPMQSTKMTQRRNLRNATKCKPRTSANPTDDAAEKLKHECLPWIIGFLNILMAVTLYKINVLLLLLKYSYAWALEMLHLHDHIGIQHGS
jgi:hypothetical protein